jgi:uncharacterized DUF497 family protein
MQFEWEPQKAARNLRDHKVSFEEASTALEDELSLTGADPDHSIGEARQITFGVSSVGRLLVVSHTERGARIHQRPTCHSRREKVI